MLPNQMSNISVEHDLLIPLKDGVSLAATLHTPEGEGPFPTLVSCYPYHKDGLIGCMFENARRYFAQHGYASLLVDMRGLGSSDGVAWETQDARDGDDCVEAIEWAARQSWCNGKVGMWGFSYGGTNTLRAAALRPKCLKAIAPMFTLSDIYQELLTRFDGLPFFGNWATIMVSMNLLPPLYQDPQGRWMEVWKDRLETVEPHIHSVKQHPEYDDYWKSRVIPVEQINIPTMVVGGWHDINVKAMLDLYERIPAKKKLVQGPWTHMMPFHAPFEPWDYLHDMKLWWDRWLKDEDNGVDEEPAVKLFVEGSNTWREEAEWPIKRTEWRTLHLADGWSLADQPPAQGVEIPYHADPTVGAMAGLWEGTGLGIGFPQEQSEDEARSLSFTSAVLTEDVEVTGSPSVELNVELESGDDLNLVAKLCAVAPDGSSQMLSVGSIKASAYLADKCGESLENGKVYSFDISMFPTSRFVPRGHRLRLNVACADFPRLWPTSTNPTIRLHSGGEQLSTLRLPVVPVGSDLPESTTINRPDPAISDAPLAIDGMPHWNIERDVVGSHLTVSMGAWQSSWLPAGGKMKMDIDVSSSVGRHNPEGARIEGVSRFELELPTHDFVEVESKTILSNGFVNLEGTVVFNGRQIFAKTWRV